MKFTKAKTTTEPSLEDRIRKIREEAEAYIDSKAEQLKLEMPELPIGVLRNILTARSNGCACAAVLNHIATEG